MLEILLIWMSYKISSEHRQAEASGAWKSIVPIWGMVLAGLMLGTLASNGGRNQAAMYAIMFLGYGAAVLVGGVGVRRAKALVPPARPRPAFEVQAYVSTTAPQAGPLPTPVSAAAEGEVVAVNRSQPITVCPRCGTTQKANRNLCFKCGVGFVASAIANE